jgi:hypothetical protein
LHYVYVMKVAQKPCLSHQQDIIPYVLLLLMDIIKISKRKRWYIYHLLIMQNNMGLVLRINMSRLCIRNLIFCLNYRGNSMLFRNANTDVRDNTLGKVNMEHQLDATITVLLISKISSKCFGQTFPHLHSAK